MNFREIRGEADFHEFHGHILDVYIIRVYISRHFRYAGGLGGFGVGFQGWVGVMNLLNQWRWRQHMLPCGPETFLTSLSVEPLAELNLQVWIAKDKIWISLKQFGRLKNTQKRTEKQCQAHAHGNLFYCKSARITDMLWTLCAVVLVDYISYIIIAV